MSLANRKRNHRVQVRLDDEEYAFFEYNLERTGLSKEVYIRNLLLNKIPKTKEENESNRNILSQLYAIGNNLNQIVYWANATKSINKAELAEAAMLIRQAWRLVKETL